MFHVKHCSNDVLRSGLCKELPPERLISGDAAE